MIFRNEFASHDGSVWVKDIQKNDEIKANKIVNKVARWGRNTINPMGRHHSALGVIAAAGLIGPGSTILCDGTATIQINGVKIAVSTKPIGIHGEHSVTETSARTLKEKGVSWFLFVTLAPTQFQVEACVPFEEVIANSNFRPAGSWMGSQRSKVGNYFVTRELKAQWPIPAPRVVVFTKEVEPDDE